MNKDKRGRISLSYLKAYDFKTYKQMKKILLVAVSADMFLGKSLFLEHPEHEVVLLSEVDAYKAKEVAALTLNSPLEVFNRLAIDLMLECLSAEAEYICIEDNALLQGHIMQVNRAFGIKVIGSTTINPTYHWVCH